MPHSKATLPIFIILLCLSFSFPANALLLEGNIVSVEYLYPTIDSDITAMNAIVGQGVEFPEFHKPNISMDITDTQILIDFSLYPWECEGPEGSCYWTPADFNGFHVFDSTGSIGSFTKINVNPLTNMQDLILERISFDENNIWVNWAGLYFNNKTFVALDIIGQPTEPAPVPEPATLLLLGSGLAGLAFYRRKRK